MRCGSMQRRTSERPASVQPVSEEEERRMTVEAVARGDHHTLMQLATRRHKQQVRESAWHRRLRRGVERRMLAAREAAGRARREGLIFDHNSSFIFSWGVVIVVGALCEEMKAMASALELASKAIERISTPSGAAAGGASKQETE